MNPGLSASRRRVSVATAAVPTPVEYRLGVAGDAPALHALISDNLAEGHLLPRSVDEIASHAARFLVAVQSSTTGRRRTTRLVGCAELAPLSADVAEVRSLVVHRAVRASGIGRSLMEKLRRAADAAGYKRLCAFTHDADYFVRKGFTVVPHTDVPEKIAMDCRGCALLGRCGQHAVVLPLAGR